MSAMVASSTRKVGGDCADPVTEASTRMLKMTVRITPEILCWGDLL
jgi:hypothetical protein